MAAADETATKAAANNEVVLIIPLYGVSIMRSGRLECDF